MPRTPYELCADLPLDQVRFVAIVPRYSVVPVIRRQNVGEHCFLVARYVGIICEKLGIAPGLRVAMLDYALRHDDDEAVTGDIPTPIKAQLGYDSKDHMKKDRPVVYWMVKLADRLEAVKYMHEEMVLGNGYMRTLLPGAVLRMFEAAEQLQAFFSNDIKDLLNELQGISELVRRPEGSAEDDLREEGLRVGDGAGDRQDADIISGIFGVPKSRPN